jgi:hypothetical protein
MKRGTRRHCGVESESRGTHWSVDASLLRSGRKFTERLFDDSPPRNDTLPTMDGLSTIAIGRFAWGDPMSGPWFQALASAQSFSIRNPPRIVIDSVAGPGGGGPGGSPGQPDSLEVPNDTTQSRPQFVLSGGLSRGQVRLSALGRFRRWRGETSVSPAIRVGYESGGLTLSFLGERSPLDSLQRLEGGAHLVFGGRFAVSGTLSRFTPIEGAATPTSLAIRAEVGMRAGRVWLTGGAIRRDTSFLPPAIAFDPAFRSGVQGASNGLFATMRGKFFRDVGLDVSAIRYEDAGVYRPQYETRSRLYLDSDMRANSPAEPQHFSRRDARLSIRSALSDRKRDHRIIAVPSWTAELGSGSLPRQFSFSTAISSERNTSRSRALRCRALRRCTGFAGASSIDKVVVAP